MSLRLFLPSKEFSKRSLYHRRLGWGDRLVTDPLVQILEKLRVQRVADWFFLSGHRHEIDNTR